MIRTHRSRAARRLLVVVSASMLLAACAGEANPLEIGLRRVALDLAFRDADKALPVPPQEIITQIIPAEMTSSLEELTEVSTVPRQRTVVRVPPPPPPRRAAPCPGAEPTATPNRDAFAVVKDPPRVGTYPRRNVGELDITFATFNFKVPYPPSTVWDIPRVEVASGPPVISERDKNVPIPSQVTGSPTASPPSFEFDIVRHSLPGFSVTTTYSYTQGASGGDYLYLRKRVTMVNGSPSVFIPSPPIRVVRLGVSQGGDGTTRSDSNHGGVDRETNVAMTIQSDVIGREWVDVCGEVFDTFIVRFQERVVDLSKNPPDVSGNNPDAYNVWNIQFDNGLLLVREAIDTVTRTSVSAGAARVPVEIRAKYTSTLRSPDPSPLGTPPLREALTEPPPPPPRDAGDGGEETEQ